MQQETTKPDIQPIPAHPMQGSNPTDPSQEAVVFLAQQVLELKKEVENIKSQYASDTTKDDVKSLGDKHSEMDKGFDERVKSIVQAEIKTEMKGLRDDIKNILNE